LEVLDLLDQLEERVPPDKAQLDQLVSLVRLEERVLLDKVQLDTLDQLEVLVLLDQPE
jgi:hypothetical protein